MKRSFGRPSPQRAASASATQIRRCGACRRTRCRDCRARRSASRRLPTATAERASQEPLLPAAEESSESPRPRRHPPRPRRRAPSRTRFPPPLRPAAGAGRGSRRPSPRDRRAASRPRGPSASASPIVSPICISPTSCTIDSGIAVGSASTFSSRVICSSTPPSFTPGASSVPVSSIGTTAWIAWSRRTRSRSMCTVSPRTGSRWVSFSTTGVALPPSTLRSSTAPERGEREPQLARVGVEAHRIAAAAVQHAGHAAAAAQAPHLARAARCAAVHIQLCRRLGHRRRGL